MKNRIALLTILCIFLLPAIAFAATLTRANISQTAQEDDVLYAFFDVSDESGAPIAGLEAADIQFSLGTQEPAASLQAVSESGMGIGYVFAVDISKSLSEKEFEGVREALGDWIDGMREEDCAAILTFGEEISVLTDFTSDMPALRMAVKQLAPTDDKTQLYNGILRALDVTRRQGEDLPLRRVLVILSDGIDDFPTGATMAEVTQTAAEAGVPIYAVGVEIRNNQAALNELGSVARLSGGDLYLTEEDDLSAGYGSVYARVQSGYVAKIQLDHTMTTGSAQTLFLTVRQGTLSVEDSVDVRLKAVAAPAMPRPVATQKPAPTPLPTPEPPRFNSKALRTVLLVALSLFVISGAAATFLIMKRKKDEKARQVRIGDIKRRDELDKLIDVGDSKAKDDKTRALGPQTARLRDDATMCLDSAGGMGLMLCLAETKNNGERQYTAPLRQKVTVGRKAGENDITIPDKSISGQHCEFEMRDDFLYLRDLGSTNGTFVMMHGEARRVGREGLCVKNADVIRIGQTELSITIYES